MNTPLEKVARLDSTSLDQPLNLVTKKSLELNQTDPSSEKETLFPNGATCLTSVVEGVLGECILHDTGKDVYLSNL